MRSGEVLKPWTVVAENDASDSGNQIHDDAVAQKYGFRGGLVPGVTVYGYMTAPLVAAWGEAWLDRGGMAVRLRRPIYEGGRVRVEGAITRADAERTEAELTALNEDGEACGVGTGWLLRDAPAPRVSLPPRREIPATRWPPRREFLERERVLGTVEAVWKPERTTPFLEAMQDPNAVYRKGAVHPAWLLRLANLVVDRSIDVNPWIHVSSELQHYRRAHEGEILETRAQVVNLFEKSGHEYADFDVVILARRPDEPTEGGVPILSVLHRAIYRPRVVD